MSWIPRTARSRLALRTNGMQDADLLSPALARRLSCAPGIERRTGSERVATRSLIRGVLVTRASRSVALRWMNAVERRAQHLPALLAQQASRSRRSCSCSPGLGTSHGAHGRQAPRLTTGSLPLWLAGSDL